MDFGTPRKPFIVLLLVTLAFVVVGTVRRAHPWESPTEQVHRLCEGCGLTPAELINFIDYLRGPSPREAKLRRFRATFDDAEQAELWLSCAEALIDAAQPAPRW